MRKKIYKELIKPFINKSYYNEIKRRLNYLTLQNYNEIQQKGGYNKIIKYNYKGYIFKTILTSDGDDVLFMIYKNNRCFILKIDLEENGLAILEGFMNEPKCSNPKLPKNGGGKIMMFFLLDYVKKYHPLVKRIELTDNSQILCNNDKINLSGLYILTHGTTWYGIFGFEPVNDKTKERYKYNIELMNKIKVKDVWDEFKDLFNYYKIKKRNKLLKYVLKKILMDDCSHYEDIWEYMLIKYKIKNMYGKNFVLFMDKYKIM